MNNDGLKYLFDTSTIECLRITILKIKNITNKKTQGYKKLAQLGWEGTF